MAKAGRKAKPGKRTKSGQLSRAGMVFNDGGNDRVQARREAFQVFQGGKADQQIADPIGRAWAAGLLDGQEYDSAALRDAGRDYGIFYTRHWPTSRAVAPYGAQAQSGHRGEPSDAEVARERQFTRLDALVRSAAGFTAYSAMQELCVEGEIFPDDDPAWLTRLIASRLPRFPSPPQERDKAMMANVIVALCVMVGG